MNGHQDKVGIDKQGNPIHVGSFVRVPDGSVEEVIGLNCGHVVHGTNWETRAEYLEVVAVVEVIEEVTQDATAYLELVE